MCSHPAAASAFLALLAAGPAAAQTAAPSPSAPPAPARPCAAAAEHRAFDFWIGEWDVRPAAKPDQPPSHSRVEINLGPDKVRQFFEKSKDGGRTWESLWDLIYTRRAAR